MIARAGLLALVGAGLLGSPSVARACQWWVDGDAEAGGEGTASSPFASLPEALAAPLEPGDTVCLRDADVPYPGVTLTGVDGSLQQPLVLTAAPGHAPIIGGPVVLLDVSHWVLRGLVLDGRDADDGQAIRVQADGADVVGVEVRECTIVHWPRQGVAVGPPTGEFELRNVVVADNYVHDVLAAGLELRGVDGVEVIGNLVEGIRCESTGEQAGAQSGIVLNGRSQRATVAYNTVRDFPACPQLVGIHTQGIRVHQEGVEDGEIHHNLVEDLRSEGSASSFAGGISLHDGASRWWVHHNVIRRIGLEGAGCGLCDASDHYDGSAGDDCETDCNTDNRWEHNTVLDTPFGIRVGKTLGTRLSDNLVLARDNLVQAFRDDAAFSFAGNLYWQYGATPKFKRNGDREGLEQWQAACDCDEGAQVLDPLLDPRDGVTPSPESPAIDAGSSTAFPFHGQAPDLGALEPPVVGTAEVDADAPDQVRLRVRSRVAPPLQPLGGCEGLQIRVDEQFVAVTGCAAAVDELAGEVTVTLSLLEPLSRGAAATLVHTGALTDTARIGGRIGARLPAFALALDTSALPEREPAVGGCRLSSGPGRLGWLGLLGLLVLARRRRSKPR